MTAITPLRKLLTTLAFVFVLVPAIAFAQSVDDASEGAVELPSDSSSAYPEKGEPARPASRPTGRKAAEKYMGQRGNRSGDPSYRGQSGGSGDHYLAVHIGAMVSDTSYRWGQRAEAGNTGSWNFGVTYRIGEWINSMDLNARVDVQRFHLPEGSATKLSFLPVITFPDASSKFPLFFGVGAGLGIFATQIPDESALSFDYQLIAGARFFDVWPNTGLFVEAGMKNSAFILSDGQINGLFVSGGAVFAF